MKRKALLLLFAGLAFANPAHAQNVFLLGFTGFDYQTPPPIGNGSFLGTIGDQLHAVGFVTSFGSDLSPGVNGSLEHTFYLTNATVSSSSFSAGVLEVVFQSNARFDVFEDGTTAASYGTNPPNGTSPSSFNDGALIIGADVDNLTLVYDYNSFQGYFDGTANLDNGSLLSLIHPSRRNGYVFSGAAGQPNPSIPAGYEHQLSGQMEIPGITPTAHKSWGAVKALYR